MSWRLAPTLELARREANAIAPNRKRTADGTIGDAAHAASKSDHNPTAEGWVNALDLTHDPAGGFDAHAWADRIAARNDPRVKYLISRGRIWNPTIGDKPGAWRPYSGANPHNSHLHISVRDTVAARNDTSPWFGKAVAADAAPQPPGQKPPKSQEDDPMTMVIAPDGSVWSVGATDRLALKVAPREALDAYELHKALGYPTFDCRGEGGARTWAYISSTRRVVK